MSVIAVPADMGQALAMLEGAMGFLADADAAQMPAAALAECLRALERADAVGAAARGQLLAAFDAADGHLADGQRSTRAWLVNCLRVTRGQAAGHLAVERVAREHRPLLAGLREGHVITCSVAVQLARWTRAIPAEFREQAEEFLVAASRAGADLRTLARFAAEIRYRTAPPDPDDKGREPDRGLDLATTFDGAGVIRGDLSPQCTAMVAAVLDALSAPAGAGDLRTRAERCHDALAEAMRRLLASGLLPKRAGQPVKALVHIYFAELAETDPGSALQDRWIAGYRAAWAGHRAAASVAAGDGGAWLEGDAARDITADAMIIPVVTGDIDPAAIEDLIAACVQYHRVRSHAAGHDGAGGQPGEATTDAGQAAAGGEPGPAAAPEAGAAAAGQDRPDAPAAAEPSPGTAALAAGTGTAAQVLAMLEHQILGQVIKVVSGPGGIASFLRRNLLGKGLNGPSLPLDVGQSDDIPAHLRRLVALRDQTCQYPGGCDQPAAGCEPHHVVHRADGGHTSLANLKDYCWWHHHVVLHQLGWKLTVHPDGTSQVQSPGGKTIRSHSPPPRPG